MEAKYSFNFHFLWRFWNLHKLFYSTRRSIFVFFIFIAISSFYTLFAYRVGLISGNFYKVLVDKDQDEFLNTCLTSTGWILAVTATRAGKDFLARRLLVLWRKSLTGHMQQLYLRATNFYQVSEGSEDLDNPDQRLTADISSLVTAYGELVMKDLFVLPAATAYYAYKAYCASGWVGPTGMFGLFLLSFFNKFLMSPVAKKTARLEEREGDFRFFHTHLREHAEALALQGGAEVELARSQRSLDSVCTAQEQLFNWRLGLDLSTYLFGYLGAIASYLVIAIPIFGGYYDSSTAGELAQIVSQNSFVCMMLVWQMTQLVQMAGTVAGMAGSCHRVAEMLELLESLPEHKQKHEATDNEDLLCSVKEEDIVVPSSGVKLIKGLSLEVYKGQGLLVMGPSGSGKTSLLRVLRGLWPSEGGVAMVERQQVACLPQREFLGAGSLREQLTGEGGGLGGYQEEASLLALLHKVGLEGLVDRFGGLGGAPQQAWASCLSPGERQRLLWARILHQRPSLALLDEATSAVSEEVQASLYLEARARGVTVVSVGHRNSLRPLHSHLLLLDGSGGWTLNSLQENLLHT